MLHGGTEQRRHAGLDTPKHASGGSATIPLQYQKQRGLSVWDEEESPRTSYLCDPRNACKRESGSLQEFDDEEEEYRSEYARRRTWKIINMCILVSVCTALGATTCEGVLVLAW